MKFHKFTTDSPDFHVDGENLVWAISNQVFDDKITELALSSCLIHFSDVRGKQHPMILSCSLVDANYMNYNGVICSGVSEFKNFVYKATNLEFWSLDCSHPRKVLFALRGINAEKVKFANITLALR